MGLLQQIPKIFDRRPKGQPVSMQASSSGTRGVGMALARKTDTGYFGNYFAPIIARAGVATSYSEFTEELINKLPSHKIRNPIRNSNPLVAKAQADFADSIASGYTYTADKTMDDASDSPAGRLLTAFLDRIEREQGGMEVVLEEFGRDMFAHGAAFGELIIDKDKNCLLYTSPSPRD